MSEAYDTDTGEIRPNGIAAQAMQARPVAQPPPVNRSLNDAIEHAMNELPAWVQATHTSGKGTAKYATLKEILEKVRPVLLRHRVRIRQGAERSWPCDEGGGVKGRLIPVYTDFIHTVTGEIERTVIEIPLTRLDPQAMGSAITYGKRYSLLAGLGLATDEADDDGERAMPREVSEPVRSSPVVAEMKAQIDAIKSTDKLIAWGNDAKTKALSNKLSEADAALVRQHYQEHGRKLLAKPE